MTGGLSESNWPGKDERLVVEEMLRDPYSKHWEECNKFVKRRVYSKAKNIPVVHRDEIIQEVMYKVARHLPDFRFQCAFKTWLNPIVEHHIIDTHRKLRNEGDMHVPFIDGDSSNEGEHENEVFVLGESRSAEDSAVVNVELSQALTALSEYAHLHSNPVRNQLIIRMVIIEGYTHEKAAIAAGCQPPVVGYVVREAQRYVRNKLGRNP
jgi:RNA polymerase sigma factor (sigma-70 family)